MSNEAALRVLACQVDIPSTRSARQRDRHLKHLQARVRTQLEKQPVDLVVLPELSSIEYSREVFERLDELAEPVDGPSLAAWSELSREFRTHIAYGFPRMVAPGSYTICLAVAGPDGGYVGHYDKIYLAQFGASMEKEFFRPGENLFTFDISGFTISSIICADIRIPELCRTLTVDYGADIIIHSGAYARDPSFFSWHQFALTRALENQVHFISINRAGAAFGASVYCPPWIDETKQPTCFHAHNEQFLRFSVTRSELLLAREHYPFLKDRLESYRAPLRHAK